MKVSKSRIMLLFSLITAIILFVNGCSNKVPENKPLLSTNQLHETAEKISLPPTNLQQEPVKSTSLQSSNAQQEPLKEPNNIKIPSSSPTTEPEPVKMKISSTEVKNLQYIDEGTINIIKDAMNQGKEFSFFEQFKTGTQLKLEDLNEFKLSLNAKEFLERLDEQEYNTQIYLIDIDNDGTDEITISQYQGGSMGIVYFAVLKKDIRDEYCETVHFNYENGITFNLNNTLSIVRLGNKNYLLVQRTDYSDKTFLGISIYSFIDGKYAECAVVDIYSKETYTTEKGTDYSQYNEYLESIRIDDVIKITKHGEVKSGTAEKLSASSGYDVDINNDGKYEALEKRYNFTSTYHSPSGLDLKIKSTDPKFDDDPLKVITGMSFMQTENRKILQQLWCDNSHQKNLISILYRNDFDPVYRLDIYLLEGVIPLKIGWIKVIPNRNIGVKYFRYSFVPAKK